MWPAMPRPRQATARPWPIGPGNVMVLSAGESFVSARGTGLLGPCHVAVGAANAADTPSAQAVPARVAADASLVRGRLNMLDLMFFPVKELAGGRWVPLAEIEARKG